MQQHGGTLAANDISVHRGADAILERLSLAVTPGSRIGVVGPNGRGKTTLLRALAGLEELDRGSIRRSPPTLRVGYLPQERDLVPGESLLGYLARRTGEEQTAEFEARAGAALRRVGLDVELERSVAALSGGERSRAALTSILLCALRCLSPGRADERSRLRRARPAGAVPAATRRRARRRLARPRVSRPNRERDLGTRVGHPSGAPVHRWLDRVRGGPRPCPRRARAPVQGVERRARALRRPTSGAPRAGACRGQAGGPARHSRVDVEDARRRKAHRAARARSGREALAAVGAPARPRAGGALR